MTSHIGSPPAGPDYYGYSCQVWVVVEIVKELFGAGSWWAWFSLKFNPVNNVDSSNPCWLYRELSTAVQQNDIGSKLIRGYRATLLDMINRLEDAQTLTAQQAADYRSRMISAPIASFRPEVWRLDLRKISQRKYGDEDVARVKRELRQRAQQEVRAPQQLQPDEYLIDDLRDEEFEVIVTG